MKVRLNKEVHFTGDRRLESGSVGEIVTMQKGKSGSVVAFSVAFYGYPGILHVNSEDLENV